MDKLRALQYFVAAAEDGSLTSAARRLEVSVPAVQKSITALERHLGLKLFDRSVRGLALTASGDAYLEACRAPLAELAQIDESVRQSATRPAGALVIGVHPQLAQHLLLPELPAFHARFPEIQIDFRVLNRITDADASTVDVFVLHGWPEASDLVHRQLGHARSLIMAAPAYWRRHGIPQHPADLQRHTCMLMRNPAGILIDVWDFVRGSEKASVTVTGWLSSNGREVVLDAVLAGEGVARFNYLTTRAHLAAGRLVAVLQDWEVVGGPPVNLLYRPNQRRSPRVRVFIDFVEALLRAADASEAAGGNAYPERPRWHRRGHGKASSALRGLR